MTLMSRSILSLTNTEIRRISKRVDTRQAQQSRSQYSARIQSYNADLGQALVSLPQGGIGYARSITTSASQKVAVSLPKLSTVGSADAKPIL